MITGAEAVNAAYEEVLEEDYKALILGLGINDPKRIFGTTAGLVEKFGASRVLDLPASESAESGMAIGLALAGYTPMIIHQRVEFALLGFEQIVNQAAKWHYMTAGEASCPVSFKNIVGRGWGQGPQHSQTLETVFASFPGLKVFCPGTVDSLYATTKYAAGISDPVVFNEHRWLHFCKIDRNELGEPFQPIRKLKCGNDYTLTSYGYAVQQCLFVADLLEKKLGITGDLFELVQLNPVDLSSILSSIKKTRFAVVFENANTSFNVSALIAKNILTNEKTSSSKINFEAISDKDVPTASSFVLADKTYACPREMCVKILMGLGVGNKDINDMKNLTPLNSDTPNDQFKGPF